VSTCSADNSSGITIVDDSTAVWPVTIDLTVWAPSGWAAPAIASHARVPNIRRRHLPLVMTVLPKMAAPIRPPVHGSGSQDILSDGFGR
jgi:hypothetical protein